MWRLDGGTPSRMKREVSFLEADLETWVEADSTLVGEGIRWVGRQITLLDGSRLDLVGLSPEGRLVLAELKRERIDLATLAQAMRYVLAIDATESEGFISRLNLQDADTREAVEAALDGRLDVEVLLVGTALSPELDTARSFLEDRGFDVPIRVVAFSSFHADDGTTYLVREIEQVAHERPSSGGKFNYDEIERRAQDFGVASEFAYAVGMAERVPGMKVRAWKQSVTIYPEGERGRTVLYIKPMESGELQLGWMNLNEIYGLADDVIAERLGDGNWERFVGEDARRFVDRLESLLRDLVKD